MGQRQQGLVDVKENELNGVSSSPPPPRNSWSDSLEGLWMPVWEAEAMSGGLKHSLLGSLNSQILLCAQRKGNPFGEATKQRSRVYRPRLGRRAGQ